MTKPIYLLHWEQPACPKARPRCDCTGEFPRLHKGEEYSAWAENATAEFTFQAYETGIPMPIPWPVHLIIVFSGKHNRIGDFIDNVPGAIADALVKAEILRADNGKAAPGAIYHLAHSQADVVARVAIAPQCSFREMADQIVEIADFLEAESA